MLATSFFVRQHVHIGKGFFAYLRKFGFILGRRGTAARLLVWMREKKGKGGGEGFWFAFTHFWLSRLVGVMASRTKYVAAWVFGAGIGLWMD